MSMPSVEENKGMSKKFPMHLLLTLVRNRDLRKAGIAVPGIKVGDISDLAEILFPDEDFGWSSSILVADKLRPHILKQHPNLGKIPLRGINSVNYQRFVDRAINRFGLGKLEIRPVKK